MTRTIAMSRDANGRFTIKRFADEISRVSIQILAPDGNRSESTVNVSLVHRNTYRLIRQLHQRLPEFRNGDDVLAHCVHVQEDESAIAVQDFLSC
jgi:hypothetical protein